jgi:hypothetical protein
LPGCVDCRCHEGDCLVGSQLLLAHERMPGVEVDCVADRAGDPQSCAAALATAGHQRRVDGLEVSEESLA